MLKNRILSIKIAAVMLIFVLILSVLSTSVLAHSTDDIVLHSVSDYDTAYSASEILELSGVAIEDAERNYLDEHIGIILEYDDVLHTATGSNVVASLSDHTVTVLAYTYSYVTDSGVEILWTPKRAAFGDRGAKEFTFDGESYALEFTDVTPEEERTEAKLRVEFEREFTVSASTVTPLLNRAYNDAVAWDAYVSYLEALSAYEYDLVKYEAYVREQAVYDDELAAYERYKAELSVFESALADYNAYLAAMEEYKAAEQLYSKYKLELEKYNSDSLKYAEYLKRTELLDNRLSAIEATKIKMADDREVYAAIMGNAVTEVLENKSVVTSQFVGVSEDVVDTAGDATTALRELLPGYFSLETTKERYEYYINNYEALRDNFVSLVRTLDCLYSNAKVRGAIVAEGKDKKYIILVAQLSYIANALSDEPIYSYPVYGSSPNYRSVVIDENHTLKYRGDSVKISAILENKTYFIDTGDADPDDGAYPDPMTEPTPPTVVSEPTRPTKVDEPIKPDTVRDPGDPPAIVLCPTAPSEEPSPYPDVDHTAPTVTALVRAYRQGRLHLRDVEPSDLAIKSVKTVTKKVFNPEEVSVVFYGTDGELLSVVKAESGAHVIFGAALPTFPEDVSATYVFDYWADFTTGERVSLLSVTEDLILSPIFKKIPKLYPVTFNINGKKFEVMTEYGSVPTCPIHPTMADDSYFEYVFSGWDKPLSPVSGACSYTAGFDAVPLVSADAPISVEKSGAYYVIDATKATEGALDIAKVISRAVAGRYGILLNTCDAQLSISYLTLLEMHAAGDSVLDFGASRVKHGYVYTVVAGTPGEKPSYRIGVTIPTPDGVPQGARLFYLGEGGDKVYVPHTVGEDSVTFNVWTGIEYTYAAERKVDVLLSDLVTVDVSGRVVYPGDTVGITLDTPNGVAIKRVYIKCADGSEIDVSSGEFAMPDSDILLVVEAEYIEYEVLFMNGGRVVASYKCKYGDIVTPPSNMNKASDSTYRYVWLGWSVKGSDSVVEVVPVTDNVTYVAVYDKEPLPVEEPGDELVISERVLRLLITGAVALGMIVLVVIPAAVIGIVSTVKHRKMRRNIISKK